MSAVSQIENGIKVIVANPAITGFPGNGKPFADGSKVAKIEWTSKKSVESPYFRDDTRHPEIGFVHRKGYQPISGYAWMGIRPVSL
jgi:hypothetical protein